MGYPYYTEPTHVQGDAKTLTGTNASRDTQHSSDEGRLKPNIAEKISLLEVRRHPLITLLTNIGKTLDGKTFKGSALMKEVTANPEFKVQEDFYGGRYARVSGTYNTAGSATVTLTGAGSSSAHIFTVGDIIFNQRTGERMIVETIASVNTITIGRSLGTTAATAGADGDGLFIIGNASEENSGARNVNTTKVNQPSNFTQIFKTTIAVSGTEKESEFYGPQTLTWQRAKKGTEHMMDIERALWFGEKGQDTGGAQGKPRRFTGGILEHLESNNGYIQDQNGSLTAPDFNTFLREAFTYGDSKKTLFAGSLILQAVSEISRGQLVTKNKDATYGVKVSEWVTPFGDINIVQNPLLVQDLAGYGFLLDLTSYKYVSYRNRDTKLQLNVQANDVDGEIDQYLTEAGLKREQAQKCALIKGVEA